MRVWRILAIWVANSFVSGLRRPLLTCIGRGGPPPGKCLRNRAGLGACSAGPTLLQADITRGHSKAATSQETNENRRITRIEELTIVPTLATYPRLVSFVSSGESDAPAATVWVLKRSDRGSVRRYMEKMTGLSRAQTRLITVYLPGTREDIALLAGVAEVHETMSGPAASASASASASAC